MSPDLRGGAILDPTAPCSPPAATRTAGARTPPRCFGWPTGPGDEPVEQVHVATEQGEVFALRDAGLAAVAVTERFALASLMFFDMRSVLRDLAAGGDGRRVGCRLSRTGSCSTASPAMPTRRPPTCAAAASRAVPSPASTTPVAAAGDHAGGLGRRRRAVRRRGPADRGRREAGEGVSGSSGLIEPEVAERVLARALANGGEFAEVFAERAAGIRWRSTSRGSKSVQAGAEEGAGVRVLSGGTTYFAHVDGLDPDDLERAAGRGRRGAAGRARRAAAADGGGEHPAADRAAPRARFPPSARRRCCASWTSAAAARAARSPSSSASYAEARREVTVANSEGLYTRRRPHPRADRRPGRGPPRRRGRDRRRDARRATAASSCSTDDPGADRRAARRARR